MKYRLSMLSLIALCNLLLLSGCGPSTGTVSGDVNVDGKAAERGVVTFTPAEAKATSPPVAAEIVNGKYQAKIVVGKMNVQISVPRVIDKKPESTAPGAAIVEITEESLPERYNTESKLTFDVQSGVNTKNWDVESKKR